MKRPKEEISAVMLDEAPRTDAGTARHRWLAGFRRITSSTNYIPEIDGLRFIAIAAVVLHHIGIAVSIQQNRGQGVFGYGQKGVELFFVISGFVLALPFAAHYLAGAKRVRLGDYFLRRVTRLEPPYLVSLLALYFLKQFWEGGVARPNIFNLIYSVLYIHGPFLGRVSLINGVAWSLEIEIQFYLLMPLLALLFLIRNPWLRRAIFVGVALAFMYFQPLGYQAYWERYERHLLNYIQYFVAGILFADVFVTEWRNASPMPRARGVMWGDLAWLIGWPAVICVLVQGGNVERYALPPLFFLLFVALFQSVWARQFMRVPVITIVGGMCYSIYLLHNAVILMCVHVGVRWPSGNYYLGTLQLAILVVPVILLISGLFFRLLERPCMRRDWPRRVTNAFLRLLFIEENDDATRNSSSKSAANRTNSRV